MRKFGVVVCSRSGSDIERFIYESDLLTKYKVACLVMMHLLCTAVILLQISQLVFYLFDMLLHILCIGKTVQNKSVFANMCM